MLVAAEDDGGTRACTIADMTLPFREQGEGLERGAVGVVFECLPLRLDIGKLGMDLQVHARERIRVRVQGQTSDERRADHGSSR